MIIHNAIIVDSGQMFRGFLQTSGDTILRVAPGDPEPDEIPAEEHLFDARGAFLLPGVIDCHVHFRDPGLTQKADMESESRAAVLGGVTSFIDMPNTKPVTTDRQALADKLRRAAEASHANYGFFIGATDTNLPELRQVDYSRCAGVKLFLGRSTGGMVVTREDVLNDIMQADLGIAMVHAEDEDTVNANTAAAIEKYGSREAVPVEEHPNIRSAEACLKATGHITGKARPNARRLHIAHVSTARELDLILREKTLNPALTCETAPHYLWFSDQDYHSLGARIKCNPAIKTDDDRQALIAALSNGTIDMVATDHAPHLLPDKEGGALTAASGMPSIELSLRLMAEIALQGDISYPRMVELMSHNPARIFRIKDRGYLKPGYRADIVLLEQCDPYTVTDADMHSKCGWTPWHGTRLHHRVSAVWLNGQLAVLNGQLQPGHAVRPLEFDNPSTNPYK